MPDLLVPPYLSLPDSLVATAAKMRERCVAQARTKPVTSAMLPLAFADKRPEVVLRGTDECA
ncbi:MAG: hypothetical protein JWO59_3572 [Chloroflexi bacterium]|nr:hypothetical protein [Chloroflexota bacterium]